MHATSADFRRRSYHAGDSLAGDLAFGVSSLRGSQLRSTRVESTARTRGSRMSSLAYAQSTKATKKKEFSLSDLSARPISGIQHLLAVPSVADLDTNFF